MDNYKYEVAFVLGTILGIGISILVSIIAHWIDEKLNGKRGKH